MSKYYDDLLEEMLDQYHEKIKETVSHADIGHFLTDFANRYREQYPDRQPSVYEVDGVQVFDTGDWEGP